MHGDHSELDTSEPFGFGRGRFRLHVVRCSPAYSADKSITSNIAGHRLEHSSSACQHYISRYVPSQQASNSQYTPQKHQFAASMESTHVLTRCLCGQVRNFVELASALPQHKRTCHCNSCRYQTGVLFQSCLPLKWKPKFVERLTRYDTSEKLSRYFCGICGSNIAVHLHEHDQWAVSSGTIDEVFDADGTSLEIYTGHKFVEDTKDGGLGICFMKTLEGTDVDFFAQAADGEPVSPAKYLQASKDGTKVHQHMAKPRLRASCHCGGVQYQISHPTAASQQFSCPWPDLIFASQSAHTDNPDDVKWWLRADNTKYLAGTCTCRSCRLASGPPVQTWAFIPRANLDLMDGTPWQPSFGSLKGFASSDGVTRDFCKTCGATAFWRSERRPELIDVSVGLLRADEGVRAENWLEWWTDRVSFCEESNNKGMVTILEAGLKNIRQS